MTETKSLSESRDQIGGSTEFARRAREAFRILQAMYEGALTPDEAVKEWRRVRGET